MNPARNCVLGGALLAIGLLHVQPAVAQDTPSSGASFLDSMNPDIALILDVAAAAFTQAPMQTGGHDPAERGFNLQQLELSMGANVGPYFRLDTNIVFSLVGVEVEEAYGTTLGLPGGLQVRAGQMLTRFGRINPTHPHTWAFADQPLVIGKMLGGEGSRGLGLEVSWLMPLPWFAELVLSSTLARDACCARSFYGADDLGVGRPRDLLYTSALKQFFPLSDDWSISWGLSAQHGPNATGRGNRTAIYGTDLYVRWRPTGHPQRRAVSLHAETLFRTRQVPGDVLQDVGFFTQLVATLTPRWETGARYEWVSGNPDDDLDPEWTGTRQRASIQGTFYPSHFSRIRLQGNWDEASWRADPGLSAFLSLELLIGAHGAHTF